MGRKKRQQADHKADLRGGKWAALPVAVLTSRAYVSLPAFERALLFEFVLRFNGYNNGKISFSHREIAERMGTKNYKRIARAVACLIETGLLAIATDSVWKERRAREYRLSFISSGPANGPVPASNEYLEWKNDAEPVSAENTLSAEPLSASVKVPVEPVSAGDRKEPQNPVKGESLSAEPVSALIGKPYRAITNRSDDPCRNTPKTHAGEIGPALGELREWTRRVIEQLGYGGARTLATEADISEVALSRFRNGKSLPDRYRQPLQYACARHIPFRALAA